MVLFVIDLSVISLTMNCFDPLTLTKEDEALQIEQFLIMGSGPVNCSKRVMNAISLPILTPLHPLIFKVMIVPISHIVRLKRSN